MQAVIFGRNNKRKRGDVDYLDQTGEDNPQKRKLRLIEERMQQIREGLESGDVEAAFADEIDLHRKE